MLRDVRSWRLLLLCALPLLSPLMLPPAAAHAAPLPPMVDLARLYQRVEHAYAAAAPLSEEQRRAVGAEMDAVTRAFFRGGRGARGHLDAALLLMQGDDMNDTARFMAGLDAEVIAVVNDDRAGDDEVEGDKDAPHPTAAIVLTAAAGPSAADFADDLTAAIIASDDTVLVALSLSAPNRTTLRSEPFAPHALPEGRHRIEVRSACGRRMTAGIWMHLHAPLEPVRLDLLRRADAVRDAARDSAAVAMGHAILTERAALLVDPPARSVTEWTLDLALLRERLLEELTRFEAGEDPVADLTGNHWLRVPAGINPIPCRVIVPPFDPADPPRPLIIALHGAGGNEHLFPDGHGAGVLKALAHEHGFVVVSPSTQMTARGQTLPDLIDFLKDRAHIDPQRVSIIGHSMGGMTAVALSGQFAGRLHRIAVIAGARPVPEAAHAIAMRFYGAERDAIVQEQMVRAAADISAEQGANVTYHLVPDADHLLVVADVLREAIEFLLEP